MELICVRHGRTAWNAAKRFQGHTDVPLDDEGRAQARALAQLLRSERIDVAVTSDLVRARQTAEIVLATHDLTPRIDPGWREMRFGAWEGLTWTEITARYPELDAANETAPRAYTPDGGESFDELCARVAAATDRVVAEMPAGGCALIATHAGPLHALLRVLLADEGSPALSIRFLTASVTRFVRSGERWRLGRLNQTAEAVR